MNEFEWEDAYEFFEEHSDYFNQAQQGSINYLEDFDGNVFAYLEVDDEEFEFRAGLDVEESEVSHLQVKGKLSEKYEVPEWAKM